MNGRRGEVTSVCGWLAREEQQQQQQQKTCAIGYFWHSSGVSF